MTLPRRPRISNAELDRLIEEATVDCYNHSEHVTGLFTLLNEHLELPFDTSVLGVAVTVTGVDGSPPMTRSGLAAAQTFPESAGVRRIKM